MNLWRRITSARPSRGDEGSLAFAMLVTIIGVGLSAVLTSMVVNQLSNTSYEARRVLALDAAEAGLDVALQQVRLSTKINSDGTISGDTSLLPCDPLSGTIDATGLTSYSVAATYYPSDPQGQSATWLAANAIACAAGGAPLTTPQFAVFSSTGTYVQTGKTTTRTLNGTYTFHITNQNITGGLVHITPVGSPAKSLCIDAGSGSPAAGDIVTTQLCNSGAVAQTWAYNGNLQFVLVSSQTTTSPFGMCLDAAVPHAVGNLVVMQPCQTSKPAWYRQQWSFNDSANLYGAKSDSSNVDSYCFLVQTPNTVGSQMQLATSCSNSATNVTVFAPDSKVGAGQASSSIGQAIGQLVDFNQFGRCLDVTGQNVNAANLIAWPCKQNPNANLVLWNQRWALPALPSATTSSIAGTSANYATGTIITVYATVNYCLTSPLATAYGQYVTTKVCSGAANQQWTVYGKTDKYATSYQIVDSTGKYCLLPRDPNSTPADLFAVTNTVSKIYVAPCDGSTLQKWNADKNVIQAYSLKDVNEK